LQRRTALSRTSLGQDQPKRCTEREKHATSIPSAGSSGKGCATQAASDHTPAVRYPTLSP
jgi:hypothetical protein